MVDLYPPDSKSLWASYSLSFASHHIILYLEFSWMVNYNLLKVAIKTVAASVKNVLLFQLLMELVCYACVKILLYIAYVVA